MSDREQLNIRTSTEFRELFNALCTLRNQTASAVIRQAIIHGAREIIADAVTAGVLTAGEVQATPPIGRGDAGWDALYGHWAGLLNRVFERAPAFLFRDRAPAESNPWLNREFFEAQCRARGIEPPPDAATPAGFVGLQKSGRMVAFDAPAGVNER